MSRDDLQLLQGTLDVLVLKTVSRGPCHGYEIARWIRETTDAEFQVTQASELWPDGPALWTSYVSQSFASHDRAMR